MIQRPRDKKNKTTKNKKHEGSLKKKSFPLKSEMNFASDHERGVAHHSPKQKNSKPLEQLPSSLLRAPLTLLIYHISTH